MVCVAREAPLRFGVVSTVKPEILEMRFTPLLDYLGQKIGKKILFATGRNYDDTIDKFVDGTFDLGYIGPSPYILATRKAPGSIRLIAGVENRGKPFFHAAIIARKDSSLQKLSDLAGKRFAFGSQRSTLSFYLPYYMLLKEGVVDKLKQYDFLGRHDIVAKYVIMGEYDAGGIKTSVANTYSRYLRKIAVSEPITDFAIVVHKSMDDETASRLEKALKELKDPVILGSIKKSLSGFGPRKDSDYDRLREIMDIVDGHRRR